MSLTLLSCFFLVELHLDSLTTSEGSRLLLLKLSMEGEPVKD